MEGGIVHFCADVLDTGGTRKAELRSLLRNRVRQKRPAFQTNFTMVKRRTESEDKQQSLVKLLEDMPEAGLSGKPTPGQMPLKLGMASLRPEGNCSYSAGSNYYE